MLVLVGVNHRSAPVALREKLAFPEGALGESLGRLVVREAIGEALILSTCNRVEVIVQSGNPVRALAEVRDFLGAESGITREQVDLYGYDFEGLDVVRHVLQVACGLDSLVLGESQILGQLRRAYAAASEAGSTGPLLRRMFQQVLSAAKRIRHETGISRHAFSIGYAAVALARKIFGDLEGRSVLLLGAGKMAELAARHLTSQGVADLTVSSRTYAHALALAERIGAVAVPWDEAFLCLRKVDVVVTGTAASEPIVRKRDVQDAMRVRRNRPLFMIDVAVPRDVEESVNDLESVYVYDIDALQGVVAAHVEERQLAAERAHRRIETEVEIFGRAWHSREVVPTIVALRRRLHDVGRSELLRLRRKLGSLDPDQEEAVRELAYAIIQKVLHPPIRHLKRASGNGAAEDLRRLYREIFDLPRTDTQGADEAAGGEPGVRAPSSGLTEDGPPR